jgi:hypothetical protein
VEDLLLQPAQRGGRLHPQLVGDHGAHPPVGGERVGLAPQPVEREHELTPGALTERMGGDMRFEESDGLVQVAAGQLGIGEVLERGEARLLEPLRLHPDVAAAGHVEEWPSSPERHRLSQ